MAALLLAASSMCVTLSESVSDSHRRAKFLPQVQRRRLLRLAFFAGGAEPFTGGTGLFGAAELAWSGMADSPDGPTGGGRPNVTSIPRRNCDECVPPEGLAFAARYALPAGDA